MGRGISPIPEGWPVSATRRGGPRAPNSWEPEEEEEGEEEEEEEEESLFKADTVNEEDAERDRATQV